MRDFDGGFYRNLRAMYDNLGISYIPQRYLFTFSRLSGLSSKEKGAVPEPVRPTFIHSSNNHRFPPLRPKTCGLIEWMSEIVYLAVCSAVFATCCFLVQPRESSRANTNDDDDDDDENNSPLNESLGQYLRRLPLPHYFVQNYLLTLFAGISTCSHGDIRNFPASDVVSYVRRRYNTSHYVVSGGVRDVQRSLSRDLQINLRSRVTSVIPAASSRVSISWESATTQTSHQRTFDHVVIAVAPDAVGSIFAPLSDEMRNLPTVFVESIVHTDTTPVTSIDKTSSSPSKPQPQPQPFTTLYPTGDAQWIHMRALPHGRTETIHERSASLLVTNNPLTPIDSSRVLSRTVFTRTLRTPRSRQVIQRLFGDDDNCQSQIRAQGEKSMKSSSSWRNGNGNVWLVGSWCWDGMVLLEGCIVSSMRVADALGVPVPWRDE